MKNNFEKNKNNNLKRKSISYQYNKYKRTSKFSYDESLQRFETLSQSNNTNNIRDNERQIDNEKMFNFSKIHLNIINILNKYPDEDFYEDTSLSKKNINKSNDKIYKLRKSIINNRRDLDIKNNIISEINNHKRTSKNKKIQLNPIESDNLNNSMYKKFPNGKYFSLIEKDNSNINKYLRNFSLNQKKVAYH